MPDDIEVQITDNQNQNPSNNEPPVSIVESDGDTLVHVGEDKPSGGRTRDDEERWRRAEDNQNRLAAGFDELRSRLSGGSQPQHSSSPSAPDPWKSQEDALSERERALGIQWEAHKAARSLTPQLLTEFDQKSREIQQERINIATNRALNNMMPQVLQATQQQQFRNEFSDVHNNPNANRWARGHYDILVAQGAPDSPETVRKAMNAARVQFRIGNFRMDPTDHDRNQLTGVSGTNRRTPDSKSTVVKMGKAEKGMAMEMYGDRFNGDEKKAYAQWARGIGVRAQKAAQAARRRSASGW